MATPARQKILGSFYTADPVARFLVAWAIRQPSDAVLDPSCGDGVFLSAAAERIVALGGRRPQVWGVDVDPAAVRSARLRCPLTRLVCRDFFSLRPGDIPAVSVVVGNPPFIRYQTFNGRKRVDALACASEVGVELPRLSSSWAPFLIHSARFLQNGGRLAMVAPAELIHAQYALEVLRFLLRTFGRITVRMFQKRMFPQLSEDTVLLLCEQRGARCDWFSVARADSIAGAPLDENRAVPVDIEAVRSGRHRLTRYLIPARAAHLYEGMAVERGVVRLGDEADIGIGYVTGCNDYFHLTSKELRSWRIPRRYATPAVLSLGDFQGTVFRGSDWGRVCRSGGKAFLLTLPAGSDKALPGGVREYLGHGRGRRVPERFKCRTRDTWYSVPHVRVGHAFLSYMSGSSLKLVANRAGLVAPNTLHIVRFGPGREWKPFVAGWYSSLARLSCELEGHPLGGGMLKLEPSEAESVLVALPRLEDAASLVRELDLLLRVGDRRAALELADSCVLRRRFGLSNSECLALRDAARQLETWRLHR
jgi:adenine-specific DNA-methyltransferase